MLDSLLNECVHQDFHNRSQCWFLWAVSHLLWNGKELLSQYYFFFFFFSPLHLVPELWRENMLLSAVKYSVLAVSILCVHDLEAGYHRCHEQAHGGLSAAEYFGNALVYWFCHIFFGSGVFCEATQARMLSPEQVAWLALEYPLNREGKTSSENIFNTYTSTLIFLPAGVAGKKRLKIWKGFVFFYFLSISILFGNIQLSDCKKYLLLKYVTLL